MCRSSRGVDLERRRQQSRRGDGGATDLPFAVTGHGRRSSSTRRPPCRSVGIQREVPFGFTLDASYVGRKGLLLTAKTQPQPVLPGHSEHARASQQSDPTGLGVIRARRERGALKVQQLPDQRQPRLTQWLKGGRRVHARGVGGNASDKRNVLWKAHDDSGYGGPSNCDRRHVLAVFCIYDLPFFERAVGLDEQSARRVAGLGRVVLPNRDAVLDHRGQQDIAGVGDGAVDQPWTSSATRRPTPTASSRRARRATGTTGSIRPDVRFSSLPGTFGNTPRNLIYNPGEPHWDIALFKNIRNGRHASRAAARGVFQLPESSEPREPVGERVGADRNGEGSAVADPTRAATSAA